MSSLSAVDCSEFCAVDSVSVSILGVVTRFIFTFTQSSYFDVTRVLESILFHDRQVFRKSYANAPTKTVNRCVDPKHFCGLHITPKNNIYCQYYYSNPCVPLDILTVSMKPCGTVRWPRRVHCRWLVMRGSIQTRQASFS